MRTVFLAARLPSAAVLFWIGLPFMPIHNPHVGAIAWALAAFLACWQGMDIFGSWFARHRLGSKVQWWGVVTATVLVLGISEWIIFRASGAETTQAQVPQVLIDCQPVTLPVRLPADTRRLASLDAFPTILGGGLITYVFGATAAETLWPSERAFGFAYECRAVNRATAILFQVEIPVDLIYLAWIDENQRTARRGPEDIVGRHVLKVVELTDVPFTFYIQNTGPQVVEIEIHDLGSSQVDDEIERRQVRIIRSDETMSLGPRVERAG